MLRGIVWMVMKFLKWPFGVLVAACTPALTVACWELLRKAWTDERLLSPFFLAWFGTMVAWLALRRMQMIQFWCTLEHEFTHMLFGHLTLVPVTELKVTHHHEMRVSRVEVLEVETQQASGHVMLRGSNWLVTLAPYFFPTASAVLTFATWLLADEPSRYFRILLGVTAGFSVASTLQETHAGQTDLRQAGWLYCLLSLPGLNLWMYGSIMALELGGWGLVQQLPADVLVTTLRWAGFAA